MKRAFRVILPLFLILAIIATTAWYFLIYDQGLTRELLLTGARHFESTGNHKIAEFFYDVAYYQSSKDDDIAIELAEQYLALGNYTKAEHTITQAIINNATAELYIALSDLYVQQDKLLDAVNLLNGVADPAIKAELDKLRPAAPVMTPSPGFYSQYISVEIVSEGAALYVSTDADYPSIHKDLYTEPFTLSSGETVLYALSVNEQNLVSPLTICGYTVGGVIEQVEFQDPAIAEAIIAAIGAQKDDVIFTDQLWDITSFTVPAEAKSYEDLTLLPYLTELTITKESSGDLTVLSSLTRLESLSLGQIRLTEEIMEIIGAHTSLKYLSIPGCSLSTISALSNLVNLEYLDLSGNTLRNIAPIGNMKNLKELYLANNVVNDLGVLGTISGLERLDISYNAVSTLEPLRGMYGSLVYLNAAHNQIPSVQGLADLKKLQELDLSHNRISDISSLAPLQSLLKLNISNNAIADISVLSGIRVLSILNFSYNQVTELPQFQKDCELVSINASYNLLTNIDALEGLPWLNTVNIDYNAEVEFLEPLDSCYLLIQVNAFGTKVTEVSFLTEKEIIVNFNPVLEED